MQIILLTVLSLFILCMTIFKKLKWKLTTLYFATISSLSILFIAKKYFFLLEPEALNPINFSGNLFYIRSCLSSSILSIKKN